MCQLCGFTHPGAVSRRALFGGGLAALAFAHTAFAAAGPTPEGIPGDVALRQLMAGNARYAANRPQERNFDAGGRSV